MLFPDISANEDGLQEMESLCVKCNDNGITRLLLTKIPFFKEVIIASFSCDHCGYSNSGVEPGSVIQEKGVRYTCRVKSKDMMNRNVVKQASAMFRIEELDFEAPMFTSQGVLTTIEGLFQNAIDDLQQQQPVRHAVDPDLAAKIDVVISNLTEYKTGDVPFTLVLEDISGNSFIENPLAPTVDPNLLCEQFTRSMLQDLRLGLNNSAPEPANVVEEVMEFHTNCGNCQSPNLTRMKQLDIPHFKNVIIMASTCEACGFKTNEVKAGGGMEEKGKRITFTMTEAADLSRDILTSETCEVSIPDLDLNLCHTSTGGRFTTLEGLLIHIKENLGKINPFAFGDSAQSNERMSTLIARVDKVIAGKEFFKVILDDPVGNSYLQNTYAPDSDPNLTVETYERTHEQNEMLGLNDIKTENYEAD